MSAITAVKGRWQADARAEIQACFMREEILPRAVARELHISPEDFVAWLAGEIELVGIDAAVAAFVSARRDTAERLRLADTATRAGFARLLVRNAEILIAELARAPKGLRPELEDHVKMQLADLRRVLGLIEAGERATPERLIEQLRAVLRPGDRLLIAASSEKTNGGE